MSDYTHDLACAIDALRSIVASDSRDFSMRKRDAALYGILLGWDCGEGHEHDDVCGSDDAMVEMAARHGWDDEQVARLRGYHAAILRAAKGGDPE